jgi:hypothetical protein
MAVERFLSKSAAPGTVCRHGDGRKQPDDDDDDE